MEHKIIFWFTFVVFACFIVVLFFWNLTSVVTLQMQYKNLKLKNVSYINTQHVVLDQHEGE